MESRRYKVPIHCLLIYLRYLIERTKEIDSISLLDKKQTEEEQRQYLIELISSLEILLRQQRETHFPYKTAKPGQIATFSVFHDQDSRPEHKTVP